MIKRHIEHELLKQIAPIIKNAVEAAANEITVGLHHIHCGSETLSDKFILEVVFKNDGDKAEGT